MLAFGQVAPSLLTSLHNSRGEQHVMRLIYMTVRRRQRITSLSAYTSGFSMASPKLLIHLISCLQLDNSIPSRLISPEQIKGEQLKVVNGGPDQQVLIRQISSGPGKSIIYQGSLQSFKVGAKETGSCRSLLTVPSVLTNLESSVCTTAKLGAWHIILK